MAHRAPAARRRILTSVIEHKSALSAARAAAKRYGMTLETIAKAPKYDDQDIFDDPKFAATVLGFFDKLKAMQQKQVDDQHPDQMRLPAQLISCGEEAIRYAQGNDATTVDMSPELNRQIKELAATFADYVRDGGELDDLSTANRQAFANELDDMLKALKAESAIVYTAAHHRKFVGENWADKTPMTMTLGYVVVVPATKKIEYLFVPRKAKLF